MDRGGGRGRGGPARHGSSLPRTLHSSLLHTGSHEGDVVPPEEALPLDALQGSHQEEHPPYATYSTSAARPGSLSYSPSLESPFAEGSSRLGGGSPPGIPLPIEQPQPRSRHASPHLYLPPFRVGGGSTDPALYASSLGERSSAGASTFFTFPPPAPARLPPVRSLDRTLAAPSPLAPVAGPSSSRFHYYPSPGPWGLSTHDEFNERTVRRQQQWEPPLPHEEEPFAYGGAYEAGSTSDAGRWAQVSRQENLPHEDERNTGAHLSAARSTIYEPPRGGSSSRGDRTYQTQPQPTTPGRQVALPELSTLAHLQPFIEGASERLLHVEETNFEFPEARDRRPNAFPHQTYEYPAAGPWEVPRREAISRPPSPRSASRGASTASGGPPGKRPGGSDDDDSDSPRPRKVPKKTQIACFFCRGRKLKCDGQQPLCGNCQKRNHPCSYAPYPKRRGPGKAPKGHRKSEAIGASGSGESSQGAPNADQGLRPRASVETLPAYTQYPSASDTPPYAYSPPAVASSSRMAGPGTTPERAHPGVLLQYAAGGSPPLAGLYARAPASPSGMRPWGEETLMDTEEDEGGAPPL
ncbi:hypothetical protein PHLGIDRAFT_515882 [Phlebiopsis gigantea 11061_1 CR5-6]|uniref:Zn(2)-C6 fungal-type domain-containing protein n=1 Tax=Phlebiopsis gigantea (strain 11061_1 CR5-6) TaxID=745531 RepID=A0A0C3RWW8_PHLG1|nr:hypothetical protein PHLGIDRAFT_515882 [Phlebiopsis gigantea 11061_1 CR5-6]